MLLPVPSRILPGSSRRAPRMTASVTQRLWQVTAPMPPAVGAVLVGAVADRPVLQVDRELDIGERFPDQAVDLEGRCAAPGPGPEQGQADDRCGRAALPLRVGHARATLPRGQLPQSGRTSIVPIRATGCPAAISTASSRLSASIRSKPPTASLVSANGPSVTLAFPSRTRTERARRGGRAGRR